MNLYLSKKTAETLKALTERWGLDRGAAIARALELALKSKK